MRRLALLLAAALMVAACAAETVTPLTTTTVAVEEPSTTTTTVVAATTDTDEPEGPVDLCRGSAKVWMAGRNYLADCVLVPVSFVVSVDGWRSRPPAEDWVFVSWVDPTDREFRVNVAVTVLPFGDGEQSRMDSILDTEGISSLGGVIPQGVAGFEARVVDVEGARRSGATLVGGRECSTDGSFVLHRRDEGGWLIAAGPDDGDIFGVGACQIARVWVFEVGERTITIIGGTADPDLHEEAVAKIEELFEGMSFDVGAGS